MTIQKILLDYEPKKKNILPVIKAINKNLSWVSEEAIGKIARYFDISEAQVFSTASFYDEINMEKPALLTVEICDGANCQTKNTDRIIEDVERFFTIKTDYFNHQIDLKKMSCVGRCLEGPVIKVNGIIHTRMTTDKIIGIIQDHLGC